jgi:tetratricopeptide (TPR) repeat protein
MDTTARSLFDSTTSSVGAKPPGMAAHDDAILAQVTLARAAELARAGRYGQAEALLLEVTQGPNVTPSSLDLLARIHAQQGRLLEAQSSWRRAAQLDPSNDAYHAGLRRIARIQRRPIWLGTLSPVLVGLALLVFVAFAGVSLQRSFNDLSNKFDSQSNALGTELARQATAIAALTSEVRDAVETADSQNNALTGELSRQQEALAGLKQTSDKLGTDVAANQSELVNELASQRTVLEALRADVDRLSAAVEELSKSRDTAEVP